MVMCGTIWPQRLRVRIPPGLLPVKALRKFLDSVEIKATPFKVSVELAGALFFPAWVGAEAPAGFCLAIGFLAYRDDER